MLKVPGADGRTVTASMPLLPDVCSREAHSEIDESCVDAVGLGTVLLFSQASAAVKLATEFEETCVDVVVTARSPFSPRRQPR